MWQESSHSWTTEKYSSDSRPYVMCVSSVLMPVHTRSSLHEHVNLQTSQSTVNSSVASIVYSTFTTLSNSTLYPTKTTQARLQSLYLDTTNT
jgi:hypothetical protein